MLACRLCLIHINVISLSFCSHMFQRNGCKYRIEIEIEISLLTNTNNNYDWYTTTIHQTKYSRWNINNCGAGTLGQEKRYMHINVHTLTHIYMRGDEREHVHISGDSSPICKRHLESMLKGIKSYVCLLQTGHVDIEEFRCGRKGERHTTCNIVWNMERDQSFWISSSEHQGTMPKIIFSFSCSMQVIQFADLQFHLIK